MRRSGWIRWDSNPRPPCLQSIPGSAVYRPATLPPSGPTLSGQLCAVRSGGLGACPSGPEDGERTGAGRYNLPGLRRLDSHHARGHVVPQEAMLPGVTLRCHHHVGHRPAAGVDDGERHPLPILPDQLAARRERARRGEHGTRPPAVAEEAIRTLAELLPVAVDWSRKAIKASVKGPASAARCRRPQRRQPSASAEPSGTAISHQTCLAPRSQAVCPHWRPTVATICKPRPASASGGGSSRSANS